MRHKSQTFLWRIFVMYCITMKAASAGKIIAYLSDVIKKEVRLNFLFVFSPFPIQIFK